MSLEAVVGLINPVSMNPDSVDFHSLSERDIVEIGKGLQSADTPLLLIKNFPSDDTSLQNFIDKIGKPIVDFRSQSPVFAVKVSKYHDFFKSYANSNYYFSLHTDCSDFEQIPNGLAMLCVTPAEQGGESIFIKLTDVLACLDKADIEFLLSKQWTFRNRQRSILSQEPLSLDPLSQYSLKKDQANTKQLNYNVCYNRLMIEGYSELSAEELAFLDRFDALLAEHAITYKLQKNELVLCNNHKLLHGRTDFAETSQRLIQRIRFEIG